MTPVVMRFHDRSFLVEEMPRSKHSSGSILEFTDEANVREAYWAIHDGDVVLDVGAAYGSYTMCALAMGASRVLALEPMAWLADWLEHNLALNPGFSERCQVVRVALSKDRRTGSIVEDLRSHGAIQGAADTDYPFPVQFITMDELLKDEHRLDWVKMDTEGAEADILEGGSSSISRLRPRMVLEDHTRCLQAVPPSYRSRVEGFLRGHGYDWDHVPYLINGADASRDYWIAWPKERPPPKKVPW